MPINPELKRYLDQKKWRYKPISGGNLAVQVCPFCGRKKWKFWIHQERTIYRCWSGDCNRRGNLYRLKRELGDVAGVVSAASLLDGKEMKGGKPIPMDGVEKLHRNLLNSERALEYCDARGFDVDTVKHFKLGLQKKQGKLWLAIPHIHDDTCHNVKFRSMPPADKTFRRMKGRASVLFNQDALADFDEIVIAESETDAMSFWQAGVRNVVGLTCGAETFLPEWFDLLADKEKVILALDADPVGQHGARDIARRLGFDRCYNVLLPGHDANDVLASLGAPELARSIKSAEQFDVHGIVSVSDALLRCMESEELEDEGFLTPWDDVNRLLGPGWQAGDSIVLSARTGVGKTTWALNEAVYLSSLGIPTLFYCLEMSVARLAKKIAAILRKKDADALQRLDYVYARYMTRRMPFYFVEPDWSGGMKVNDVLDKIREAVKRYGVKFLVFDHLHFLCRSLQYLNQEIGQITRSFKLMTEELGICTILIAQPKKIGSDRVIRLDDIRDSGSIPMDADQVIFLHRETVPAAMEGAELADAPDDQQEVMKPETLVRIEKARFRGGGSCRLYYDGAASTFYDWADRPVRDFD